MACCTKGVCVKHLFIALVKSYRLLISPALGSSCRFEPSCSAFAMDALRLHGSVWGIVLTLQRIARCHPWCAGGLDPVPLSVPTLSLGWLTRLVSSFHSKKTS